MSPATSAPAWPIDKGTPKPPLGRRPRRPTPALPGTPAKLDVMAERAALGEALFHPDDASLEGEWALLIISPINGKVSVIGQVDQRRRCVELWLPETRTGDGT